MKTEGEKGEMVIVSRNDAIFVAFFVVAVLWVLGSFGGADILGGKPQPSTITVFCSVQGKYSVLAAGKVTVQLVDQDIALLDVEQEDGSGWLFSSPTSYIFAFNPKTAGPFQTGETYIFEMDMENKDLPVVVSAVMVGRKKPIIIGY